MQGKQHPLTPSLAVYPALYSKSDPAYAGSAQKGNIQQNGPTISHVKKLSYAVWATLIASLSPVPLLVHHLWQMAVPFKGQLLMLSTCLHPLIH